MQDSIRRDLEALLNTRQRCISPPPALTDLGTSLVEYGVPDFLSANAASDSVREDLRVALETVIQRFEPRFKTFSVTLIEDSARVERAFRGRAHGARSSHAARSCAEASMILRWLVALLRGTQPQTAAPEQSGAAFAQ
jgi:type VI secretion system protein ImpF